MSPNRVGLRLEATIVATRLMTAHRIGCVACQACWQTAPRHEVVSMTGSWVIPGEVSLVVCCD